LLREWCTVKSRVLMASESMRIKGIVVHKMKRRLFVVMSVSVLMVALGATGASAIIQSTNPAVCETEIRVASKTTGETYHSTSERQSWYKGVKKNAGATSYTGYAYLYYVATSAPTIASSGFACR
jgi:hypothetical protein